MNYIEIQNEVIRKYRIDICHGEKCQNDWQRTHAHVKLRRVCKWKQINSIQSTFTLFHEIGHIETTKSTMRRAEEEYYATVWAIDRCREYGLEIPEKTIEIYQNYIDMEIRRGERRGGGDYGDLDLWKYIRGDEDSSSVYALELYEDSLDTESVSDRVEYRTRSEAVKAFKNWNLHDWEMLMFIEPMDGEMTATNVKLGPQPDMR